MKDVLASPDRRGFVPPGLAMSEAAPETELGPAVETPRRSKLAASGVNEGPPTAPTPAAKPVDPKVAEALARLEEIKAQTRARVRKHRDRKKSKDGGDV